MSELCVICTLKQGMITYSSIENMPHCTLVDVN